MDSPDASLHPNGGNLRPPGGAGFALWYVPR